jgi:hypothetical protein
MKRGAARAAGAALRLGWLQTQRRRPGSGLFCVVLLGLTLGLLAHVAVQAKQVEVGALLGRESEAHQLLENERRHLEIELGRLKDPAKLVRIAQEQLGMTDQTAAIVRAGRPAAPAGAGAKP